MAALAHSFTFAVTKLLHCKLFLRLTHWGGSEGLVILVTPTACAPDAPTAITQDDLIHMQDAPIVRVQDARIRAGQGSQLRCELPSGLLGVSIGQA